MSVIKVNNITNRDGTSGPVIAGITTVSSTSHMVVPVGRTGQRYVDGGENIVRDGLVLYLDAKYSYPSTVGIGTTTAGAAATPGSSVDGEPYTWYDMSGYENHGQLMNSVGFGTTTGGALLFDGVNDQVSLFPPIYSYPFTASIWVTNSSNWTPTLNAMQQLFNVNINGQRVSLGIVNISGWSQIGPTLMYGGTNHWTCSNPSLTGSSDVHNITWVVYGSNDTRHKIYVDGVSKVMTNEGGAHGGVAGWMIGANSANGEYWNGKIFNVQLYNKILSDSEVLQNYNALKSRFGL